MLRITVTTEGDGTTIALEGRLTGPWVDELARCWQSLATWPTPRVRLDAVTFVDAAGRALLRTMHEQGAALSSSGCMIGALLDDIRKTTASPGKPNEAEKGRA